MLSFIEWFEKNYPKEKFPEESIINGGWFAEHGLPMIVHCTNCEMTMATPSAFIEEETGNIFCSCCGNWD